MAETLLEGESHGENVAVGVDMTPTKQQTCDNAVGTGSSVVLKQSPKDAEEVVDLILRELTPPEDWDAANSADSNPPVLTVKEESCCISSGAKADTLESVISSHNSNHATAEGTDLLKPQSGKDDFKSQHCKEVDGDVSSILKDLDQCLGESGSTEPSVVGTEVTEDNDVESVLSEITAYLSEDDNQHFCSSNEELPQDKGPRENLDTSDVENTELPVINGIHEDFDGTTILFDEELNKAEDTLDVCAPMDQESCVVASCCNEGKGTHEVDCHSPFSEVKETGPQETGDTDNAEQTGFLGPSDTAEIGIESQENGSKRSPSKDAMNKNRQPSCMTKDCVMGVSNKPTDCIYVGDDVIIDLCVTPEEEVDLVDQDVGNVTESLEDDPMDTDPQFEVIDVWPNPADSCETPPKSLASMPIVRQKCSYNPDISALCELRELIDTRNQLLRELNGPVTSATDGLRESAVVNRNEKENVGDIGRKTVPTENSNVGGSLNSSTEVSLKSPQAEQATDVPDKCQAPQDKQRNQQSVICTSQSVEDHGSENRSDVQKSSSTFLSSNSLKNETQGTSPPSSADYDAEFLQQNKKVKRNPSPECTVKSDTIKPKQKIKPIVWDRSPDHRSKNKNTIVFPAQQKAVILDSEEKQTFVAPTAKNILLNKAEMSKPQKKTAIKRIVWDRSPARQKDTSKQSPIKDGDLEICIPNKVEAGEDDVRLVYDAQKPLSPDSKNRLLEHLLKVEESQEAETEKTQPSKLKVTVSKLNNKVTVLNTVAESDPDVPCKKLKSVVERGSNSVKSVAAKSKGKTKSVVAKSSSTTGHQTSSKNKKHKIPKSSDRGHEQNERLVVLKRESKPTVQANTMARNTQGKPQNNVDAKEKSTSVVEAHSEATKRKRRSKRRKKSSDSNGSNDGQGSGRKKAKVSNDIEDELSSLLEITPIEVKVPRPKLSETLQQEEMPPSQPKETCIFKDPVDAEGGSEMLETGPGTEVTDLSEKLSKSRAKRQQQQKTSETVVCMEPVEVHFLASDACKEDTSQHDMEVHFLGSDACKEDISQHDMEVHFLGSNACKGDISQNDMEDIMTEKQTLEETEPTEEVTSRRQVVLMDDHISNIGPKTSMMEEDLDTLDLTFNVTGPVTLPGESSDLKTTFQSMLEEEDFYNENAEALHLGNPMDEIIAQERLLYNDANTSAMSTSAALEGEDHGSDNMSGYETVDEVVDSDNEVQVGGNDSQTRQATPVSSPSVKASFIILPCQHQSPTLLKTNKSTSSNVSVFVKDSKPDDSEELIACEGTVAVVKEAAPPSFTGTAAITCDEAAKVGSESARPEHAGLTHEGSEKLPSRIDSQETVSKDASEGEPEGTDSKDLPLSATSANVLSEKPVELVCKDNLHEDLGHDLRELLEKALAEAVIQSDKENAGSLEVCNDSMVLNASSSETSQIPTSEKEEEISMQGREQKSDATSAALSDQSQMSSAKEKDPPCEHTSDCADSNAVSDDSGKDPVECTCEDNVKLAPVGNDKMGEVGMSVSSQAITKISPAVVLEVCIGGQDEGTSSVKPTEHKDNENASIAKEAKETPESKPEKDQNTGEPLNSSTVKSDLPAADIRVVQDSCSEVPPSVDTSLETSAQVEPKPSSCTDTTTVFTRLENSPEKKSESGVFNRLGGYSTKLKDKKSRAECCTKPRFHPYQGKTSTESKGQENENDAHLCKESVEELNQMVAKEDKPTGSRGRKKFKKSRLPRRSRLYNKLQDRLHQEGRDIRETYYLDDVSENPYDEGRFSRRGSDPVYCLEEMPCVRNDDPSDMTSKTYRFKATIKFKFPKRDKDFHCYPAPMLPRFKGIPDKFPRHQMNKKEKTNKK
ncbi:Hypp3730 [Branchiostoma lanceolatum]|uniref:Hypp3730 protein n=2 Tax=Branchiostoma lanceolatum TaxID=7740 RepID=A0A8K0A6J7_BRALA|nr:Hypp3730 [Branchiostoma lanceolatum]